MSLSGVKRTWRGRFAMSANYCPPYFFRSDSERPLPTLAVRHMIHRGSAQEECNGDMPNLQIRGSGDRARFFDGKTFLCQKDGYFDVGVSGLADPAFMAAGSDRWEAALKRAANRAAAGRRPRIVTHDF